MSYNLVSNYLVGVFFGCGVVVIGYSVFRFCVINLKCFYLDLRVLIFIYFVILKWFVSVVIWFILYVLKLVVFFVGRCCKSNIEKVWISGRDGNFFDMFFFNFVIYVVSKLLRKVEFVLVIWILVKLNFLFFVRLLFSVVRIIFFFLRTSLSLVR